MSLPQIFGLAVVEIVGDFALKEYANNGGIKSLGLGIISYIGIITFLIWSLQNSSILLVNNAWDGMSSILESLAAYVLLGERFEHPSQYAGIGFIMIGMYLLKIPLHKQKAHKYSTLPKGGEQ